MLSTSRSAAAQSGIALRQIGVDESSPSRDAHESHDEPDRHHQRRTQEEISPEPAHRVEAHVPDAQYQPSEAVDDIPGIEPEYFQNHADQDR